MAILQNQITMEFYFRKRFNQSVLSWGIQEHYALAFINEAA